LIFNDKEFRIADLRLRLPSGRQGLLNPNRAEGEFGKAKSAISNPKSIFSLYLPEV